MTDFTHENLSGARFEDVYLTGADFHGVDLTGTRFRLVDMTGVTIRGADLVDMGIAHVASSTSAAPVTANAAAPISPARPVPDLIGGDHLD